MNLKRLTVILAVMLFGMNVMAQPPKPKKTPGSDVEQKDSSINRVNPVGTATLLMLGLGAATVGYKIRKNKKED